MKKLLLLFAVMIFSLHSYGKKWTVKYWIEASDTTFYEDSIARIDVSLVGLLNPGQDVFFLCIKNNTEDRIGIEWGQVKINGSRIAQLNMRHVEWDEVENVPSGKMSAPTIKTSGPLFYGSIKYNKHYIKIDLPITACGKHYDYSLIVFAIAEEKK